MNPADYNDDTLRAILDGHPNSVLRTSCPGGTHTHQASPLRATSSRSRKVPLAMIQDCLTLPLEKTADLPRMTVMLASFGGMPYLPDQVASIAAQRGVDLRLILSDDGSKDGTAAYLDQLRDRCAPGRVQILRGPGQGYAANFVSLVLHAPDDAGYVAFSDQDDHWQPDRLLRAAKSMSSSAIFPAIHVTARRITDAELNPCGLWQLPVHKLEFRNALVESVLPGNATVMNPRAFALLKAAFTNHPSVSSHDWAMYQILAGAEAALHLDPDALVLYRQHGKNTVGAGKNLKWAQQRLARVIGGTYGRALSESRAFLRSNRSLLSAWNRQVLDQSECLSASSVLDRLTAMRQVRPYRLRRGDQFALWAEVMTGGIPPQEKPLYADQAQD